MNKDWVLVHTITDNNSAQIAKSVLENEGINAVVINKKDSMHLHLNNASIEIYVKPDDVFSASHLINKYNL